MLRSTPDPRIALVARALIPDFGPYLYRPYCLRRRKDTPVLLALQATAPSLLWMAAWLARLRLPLEDAVRPVRELRRAVSRLGIGKATWKRLVREQLDAARAYRREQGDTALLLHLRLQTLLGVALPFDGPMAAWLCGFKLRRSGCSLQIALHDERFLADGQAAVIVEAGMQALQAGGFHAFVSEDLSPVIRHWDDIARPRTVLPWRSLRERGAAALENQARKREGGDVTWDSGLLPDTFAGYRLTGLSDSYSLWREGFAMHHCVATYTDHCVDRGMRIFHLVGRDGDDRWTLALSPTRSSGWRVHDLRGPAN